MLNKGLGRVPSRAILIFVSGESKSSEDVPDQPGGAIDELPSSTRFRVRDSMGALRPGQAKVDAAYARGYALGQEEALADSLDRWRTVLLSILEARFGELAPIYLDYIEQADQDRVARYMVVATQAMSLDEIFGRLTQPDGI